MRSWIFFFVICSVISGNVIHSQEVLATDYTSNNFVLSDLEFISSGDETSATNFTLLGTSGQAVIGEATSSNFSVSLGFAYFPAPPAPSPTPSPPSSASQPSVQTGSDGGGRGIIPVNVVPEPSASLPVSEFLTPEQARSIDIQADGAINILDFNAMMVNWGRNEANNSADMNHDGTVDIFDFNMLMVYWSITYPL